MLTDAEGSLNYVARSGSHFARDRVAPYLIGTTPGGFDAPRDLIIHTNFEVNRLRNVGVAE